MPPEGELGEPLTQLMMMQMREFTRCRHCDTPHRTDRLIQAQVIMKSLIAVDSRLSEDFSVGPKHYRAMMKLLQLICSIGCEDSQDCIHAEWTEKYPAEPHWDTVNVESSDDDIYVPPEERTFPEWQHRDITGHATGKEYHLRRIHACIPIQGAGKRSNPERQYADCHMGSSCPYARSQDSDRIRHTSPSEADRCDGLCTEILTNIFVTIYWALSGRRQWLNECPQFVRLLEKQLIPEPKSLKLYPSRFTTSSTRG